MPWEVPVSGYGWDTVLTASDSDLEDEPVLTRREQLAELWLPWCVSRDDPSVPIVHQPALHPSAMQMRVSDLSEPWARRALAWQPSDGGTSWIKIENLARVFVDAVASGGSVSVGDDIAVIDLGDVRMLREGCHRACGLWVAGVAAFRVALTTSGPVGPWTAYERDDLRQR